MSNQLTRRNILGLGGLALAAPLLQGCGGTETGGNAKRVVKFQGWDFEANLVQKNIDRFVKKSGIEVDYTPITSAQYVQKIVAEFTAKTHPDALYVYDDSLAGWVTADYLQPIDGLPGIDKIYNGLYAGNAAAMTFQGRRYGLPYYADTMAFIYNAEILAKAGVKAPPKSLEELEDQAKKIQSKGILKHPIGASAQLQDTWWSWWWGLVFASGGRMFDDRAEPVMNTTDTVTREVLGWLQGACTRSKVIDPAAVQTLPVPLENAIMAGQYAFAPAARYAVRKFNNPELSKQSGKIKMMFIPSIDGGEHGTVGNTRMYCLAKETEVRDEAFKLISYLGGYDDEGELYTARFWFEEQGLGFAFKELAEDPEIEKTIEEFADPAVYRRLGETARPRTALIAPWYTEFETSMQKHIQAVMTGQSDPAQACANMAADVARLKKKYG